MDRNLSPTGNRIVCRMRGNDQEDDDDDVDDDVGDDDDDDDKDGGTAWRPVLVSEVASVLEVRWREMRRISSRSLRRKWQWGWGW